jgi:hypothetical protein
MKTYRLFRSTVLAFALLGLAIPPSWAGTSCAKNHRNMTASDYAFRERHLPVLALLKNHGAQPTRMTVRRPAAHSTPAVHSPPKALPERVAPARRVPRPVSKIKSLFRFFSSVATATNAKEGMSASPKTVRCPGGAETSEPR